MSIHGLSNIRPLVWEVRLSIPFQALSSIPGISCKLSSDNLVISSNKKNLNKVVIWQRPVFKNDSHIFRKVKALIDHGCLLIIDYDDDPRNDPRHAENDYLTFRMAHAVQVSTPALAEQIKLYNPEVQVFPNNILSLQPNRDRDLSKGLRIFFGALNREQDWWPYMPALNNFLVNDSGFWSFSVVHDYEFYKQLRIPEHRKSFTKLCSYNTYLKEMSACDIAFMPLQNTEFNKRKSDLKAVEAASLGLIPLASELVYGDSFIDQQTAALFRTSEQLIHILKTWREEPKLALDIAQKARYFVGESRLQCYQIARREAWYRELCKRRDELNHALYERIPRLIDC